MAPHGGVPQKALYGGIPGGGFGIWGRFCSHFVGSCCQKLTNLSRIDFEIPSRRALRGERRTPVRMAYRRVYGSFCMVHRPYGRVYGTFSRTTDISVSFETRRPEAKPTNQAARRKGRAVSIQPDQMSLLAAAIEVGFRFRVVCVRARERECMCVRAREGGSERAIERNKGCVCVRERATERER